MNKELDEGQKRILKATEELLDTVKARGGHMNILDCVCRYCHKEFGSAFSDDGFPWDVKFVCDDMNCKMKDLARLEKENKNFET